MRTLHHFIRRQRSAIFAFTLLQAFFMTGGAEAVELRQQGHLRAEVESQRLAKSFGIPLDAWHEDPPSWLERSQKVVVEEVDEVFDHSRQELTRWVEKATTLVRRAAGVAGEDSGLSAADVTVSLTQTATSGLASSSAASSSVAASSVAASSVGDPVGTSTTHKYIPKRPALAEGEGERSVASSPFTSQAKAGLTAQASDVLPLHHVARKARTVDASSVAPAQRSNSAFAPASLPSQRSAAQKAAKAIAPEIVALAASLDNAPGKIFRYVHDQIVYDPKWGADSPPVGTLWEGGGTSWDQAWLLQELLIAAGVDARLEWGDVEVPPSLLTNLTGIDDPIRAGDFLSTAGLPVVLLVAGSQVIAARFPHVWVKAHVDYIPNRGATAGTADTWIRMDPSLTTFESADGLRLDQDVPFVLADHLNSGTELSPRQDYDAALLAYAADQSLGISSLDDLKTLHTPVVEDFPFVPGTLRAKILSSSGESETLPSAFEQSLEIQLRAEGGGPLLTWNTTASAIYGQRFEVIWAGATASDQAALDLYGGVFAAPPYEVDLRPTLHLGGAEVASGTSIGSAEDAEIQLTMTPPDGVPTVAGWDLFAGEHGVLSLDFGRLPQQVVDGFSQGAVAASNAFEIEGWQLAQASASYLNTLGGDLDHLSALRWHRLLTLGTAIFGVQRGAVSTSPDGTPQTFSKGPLSLDVGAMPLALFPVDGVQISTVPTLEVLGSQGSFQEGEALEAVFGGEHLTGVTFLTRAVREGQTLTLVDVTNVDAALAAAEISSDAKSSVRAGIDRGMVAWISENQIESNTFQTTGYILENPTTGSGGYFVTFERRFTPLDGAVTFHSPIDLDVITAPTDVIATIDAEGLESWTLSTRPVGSGATQVIATGNGPVENTLLGQFDPTLLLNGMHDLVLTGQDAAGQPVTGKITVSVEGNMKIGQFTLSFVDMALPLSGLNIEIVRTYDSRRRTQQGDFGQGWNLDIRQGSYRNNRPPGDGWQVLATGGPFGLPCQQVVETKSHLTTVRLSDQEVYRFRLKLVRPATVIGGCFADAVFELIDGPFPGATLDVVGNNEVIYQVQSDRVIDRDSLEIFVPENVRLTTPDGRIFILNLSTGVTHLEDFNGNALEITPQGITHSSGQGIEFVRDAEGRIERIIDPLGNSNVYAYDASGDHIAFTDRVGATTRFGYVLDHFLQDVENAQGVRAVRTEYDAEGRMVRLIDAGGNVQVFDHDLDQRREVVTNRLGFVRVLEYDDRGNVVRQVDESGAVTSNTYNDDDQLLTETDPLGFQKTHTYDGNGFLASQTDSLGQSASYVYDAGGRLLEETTPGGSVARQTYDAAGNLLSAMDRESSVTQFFYDGAGNNVRVIDALGFETVSEYDATGALTRRVPPAGAETVLTYDAGGRMQTMSRLYILPDGSTETLTDSWVYDAAGREITKVDVSGASRQTTYDSLGNIESITDELGRVTTYEYDLKGRKILTRFPDGTTEAAVYDLADQLISSTDRGGRTTSVIYDPVGRPIEMIYPDGTSSQVEYDSRGQRTATIDERGHRTEMLYDLAGRLLSVTDAVDNTRTMSYDVGGRLTEVENARGHKMRFEYDNEGRLTRQIFPDGTSAVLTYDALGQRITETDRAGNVTTAHYDALGQLERVTDALGQDLVLAYDHLGNRVSQTDANGNTTTFQYDVLGRPTSRTLPNGEMEQMLYLADGSLLQHRDFDGVATTFTYDTAGRLIRHGTNAADEVDVTYTASGQIASMTDASGPISFSYDARDRLVEKIDPKGHVLSYSYDAGGNTTLLEVAASGQSFSTVYSYDAVNRIVGVQDALGGMTTVGYDSNGNRTSIQYPNGVDKTLTYDALDQLTAIVANDAAGGTLESYQYILGPAGHRTQLQTTDRTHEYSYDALYRLVQERVLDGSGQTIDQVDFSYDGIGNRVEVTSTSGGTTLSSFDNNDQLLAQDGVPHTWDDRGNLLSRGTGASQETFSWDSRSRLVGAVVADGTVQHQYDAEGNWIAQMATAEDGSESQVDYVVDTQSGRSHIVAEVVAGQVEAYYTRLDHFLIGMSNPLDGSVRYPLMDGLGSIRSLVDETATITDQYDYDAYGQLTSVLGDFPNPYRFAGQRLEDRSGLYHNRARWMDPAQGRFLSIDPASGDLGRPSSLNRYLYAEADPINRIDPLGLESFLGLQISNAIRGIVGAISSFLTAIYQSVVINIGRATFFFLNNQARLQIGAALTTLAFAFIDLSTRYILNNIEIVPIGDNEPGEFVERKMGANKTKYDVIDDFRDETATSIKTRQANKGADNLLTKIESDAKRLGKLNRFVPKKQFRNTLPIIPGSAVKHRVLFVVIPETRINIAISPSFLRSVQRIQSANNVLIRVVPLRRWRR